MASVMQLSVPAPPLSESLPLIPSLDLRVSVPPTPARTSGHAPPISTFAAAEPVSLSPALVPLILETERLAEMHVLPDGPVTLARPRVHPHQPNMRLLVPRFLRHDLL